VLEATVVVLTRGGILSVQAIVPIATGETVELLLAESGARQSQISGTVVQ
jgi:hypothetical protein